MVHMQTVNPLRRKNPAPEKSVSPAIFLKLRYDYTYDFIYVLLMSSELASNFKPSKCFLWKYSIEDESFHNPCNSFGQGNPFFEIQTPPF